MQIASWNVNSIRTRAEHVTRWLQKTNVDVLLLQELKSTEFPFALFEGLGYHGAAVTQKTYNGVAILSRTPIEVTSRTLLGTNSWCRKNGQLNSIAMPVFWKPGLPVSGS